SIALCVPSTGRRGAYHLLSQLAQSPPRGVGTLALMLHRACRTSLRKYSSKSQCPQHANQGDRNPMGTPNQIPSHASSKEKNPLDSSLMNITQVASDSILHGL